jgi:DNA processing protein
MWRELARGDEGYPDRLAALDRPPGRVFLEGPWDETEPVVAIVGSRDANGDGLDLTVSMASELARAGVAVISGLARGIDAAAHRGALDAGGRSGAILGTPLDRVYPRGHRALQRRLAGSLGLLTELPPGSPVTPGTFATRNRLLAAMADAVIVVQGREASGSLLTAAAARQLGRPVGAVPWDPREELGAAPLGLIRGGTATLVRDARDVVDLLPPAARAALPSTWWDDLHAGARLERPRRPATSKLSKQEAALFAALRQRAEPLEIAAARSGLSIPEACAALVTLELLGDAERAAGGTVRRGRGRR